MDPDILIVIYIIVGLVVSLIFTYEINGGTPSHGMDEHALLGFLAVVVFIAWPIIVGFCAIALLGWLFSQIFKLFP